MTNTVIISSFNEPKTIGKAIDSFRQEGVDEIIVVVPDDATIKIAREHGAIIFKDQGKGKSAGLNEVLKILDNKKGNIIFSDGDVYVGENAIKNMIYILDEIDSIGCVTGRVVPTNDPTTKFGYFAHTLALGADKERKRRQKNGLHLNASGYLWAIKKGLINEFPKDCAEDSIIPLLLLEKGYKTAYSPESIVYVKYPETIEDFIEQKTRTAEAHKNLNKYIKNPPIMKSFLKEAIRGFPIIAVKSMKEIGWVFQLIFLRLIIWIKARNNKYKDGWNNIPSTK